MNKLKPYRFVDDNTLQPVVVKPSDMTVKYLLKMKPLNYYLLRKTFLNMYFLNHY
jgi:hypothetical protein